MRLVQGDQLAEYAPNVTAAGDVNDRARRVCISLELGNRVDTDRDLGDLDLLRRIRLLTTDAKRSDRDGLLDIAGYCQALVERIDRAGA